MLFRRGKIKAGSALKMNFLSKLRHEILLVFQGGKRNQSWLSLEIEICQQTPL